MSENRGSYMSDFVLLILINEFDKMIGYKALAEYPIFLSSEFIKVNNTQ